MCCSMQETQPTRQTRVTCAPGLAPYVKAELESLGFRIILYPLTSIFATAYSMKTLASHIQSNSTTNGYKDMLSFHEFESVVDLQKYQELDAKFLG